ncbi:MAG: hypothetical protein A2V67_04915 [Deltaproteobacteria bacterium RBG_13_61_14]|nr:MAG: hypothetical protein A2V67_04915 [Deltaproteobacteria bacterium RBG_13_61_14]
MKYDNVRAGFLAGVVILLFAAAALTQSYYSHGELTEDRLGRPIPELGPAGAPTLLDIAAAVDAAELEAGGIYDLSPSVGCYILFGSTSNLTPGASSFNYFVMDGQQALNPPAAWFAPRLRLKINPDYNFIAVVQAVSGSTGKLAITPVK